MSFKLDKSHRIDHIVCHSNCPDGTVSAIILSTVYPYARVTFVNYGELAYETIKAEEGMLFCDITPPLSRAQEFEDVGVVVLDHHKKELVDPYRYGYFSSEPGVSGAVLAFRAVEDRLTEEEQEHFESLSTAIGVRDTWMKESGLWKSSSVISSGIHSLPFDSWKHKKVNRLYTLAETLGEAARLRTERTVKEILESPFTFKNDAGNTFLLTSGGGKISDLDDASPFDVSISFSYILNSTKPIVVFSLRSKSFDVRSIAEQFGGGGHQKAAGFHLNLKPGLDPVSFIIEFLKPVIINRCG